MQLHRSTYISGTAHAALLGYALFGGLFAAEPLDLPSVNVSTISAQEFAALTAPPAPPVVQQTVPALALPDPEPEPVEPPPAPAPDRVPQTPPQPPEPILPEPILPEPVLPEPVPEQPAPPEPPQPLEEAVILPDVAPDASTRPVPRPADRVASEVVDAQPEDAAIDNTVQEATVPDETAQAPLEELEEAAPEEATTEIVTEAEEPAASAPAQTMRPQARPRPVQTAQEPQAESTDESDSAQINTQDAVAAALAEALGEPDTPAGATLTEGEVGGFKLAVQGCWDVDVGSRSADVTVVVSMSMNSDGTVQQGTIAMVSATGSDDPAAVQTAFLRARRAIFECQREGYDLPEDRYDLWEQVEITFNPKDMRIR